MKTKHWPVVVIGAYFVVNMLLIFIISAFVVADGDNKMHDVMRALPEFFPFALIVSFVLFLCQFLLFDIKVDVVEKRPVPKRKIGVASIFLSLIMAAMTFTLVLVMFFVSFGEDGGGGPASETTAGFILMVLFFGSWVAWGIGFAKMYVNDNADSWINKVVSRMLAGSILELVVAIPSHIIMRSRGDCCAPMFSYFGIVMGVTVALFAFGPGLVFLYMKRMQAKKGRVSHGDKPDLID